MEAKRKWVLSIALMSVLLLPTSYAWPQLQKIDFSTPIAGSVGLLTEVIKKHDLDKKHGVDLVLKKMAVAEGEKAVLYKTVEAGFWGPVPIARVNLKGNRVRGIGPLVRGTIISILAPPDSKIKSWEDLKGKKLGSMKRVTSTYNVFDIILTQKGYKLEKDFKLVFGSGPGLMAFLKNRDVDAIMLFDPLVSKAIAKGFGKEIISLNGEWRSLTGEDFLLAVIGTYQEWIDKNPEGAKKLARTLTAGMDFITNNIDDVLSHQAKFLKIKSDRERNVMRRRLKINYPSKWDKDVIKSLNFAVRKARDLGTLPSLPKEELFLILK